MVYILIAAVLVPMYLRGRKPYWKRVLNDEEFTACHVFCVLFGLFVALAIDQM